MVEKLAKFFSFLFHPLLLATFAVIVMFFFPSYLSHYQYTYKKAIVLVVFLSTFISPLLIMLILLNLKVISDISLPKRKERYYPLAIVSLIYITAYIIIARLPLGIPSNISNFILMSTIVIFSVLILNLKIKISAHMAGIGGFIGFFYIFFLKESMNEVLFTIPNIKFTAVHFFSILIIIAGVVATARSAHMAGIVGFIGFFYNFSLNESINEVLFTIQSINFTAVHFFSLLILIAGIIATARLILKAHTANEISFGFFLGLTVGLLTAFID